MTKGNTAFLQNFPNSVTRRRQHGQVVTMLVTFNVFIQFPVTLNFRYKANKTGSMNEKQSITKIS